MYLFSHFVSVHISFEARRYNTPLSISDRLLLSYVEQESRVHVNNNIVVTLLVIYSLTCFWQGVGATGAALSMKSAVSSSSVQTTVC